MKRSWPIFMFSNLHKETADDHEIGKSMESVSLLEREPQAPVI
jgi:hypothetical protein